MMYYTLLVVSLIVAADAAWVRDRRGSRIVGGHAAEIEDYPYQISLQHKRVGHWCGGSIISKTYVLTAAHCLGFANEALTVRAGSSYHADKGDVHNVIEQIVYDDKDIAIIKVDPPFKFDETKQPIKLAVERPKVGSLANVTGWGDTKDGGSTPDKLQVVQVPIISGEECSKAYRRQIPEHEVCAGYLGVGGKDSCQGDSGGPLVVDGLQVGVVSWGRGCAWADYPGVYVDVAYFNKWIKTTAQI